MVAPSFCDMLIRRILPRIDGIRPARPVRFNERAFLNDKLDLTQGQGHRRSHRKPPATQAAHVCLLQGQFSGKVQQLVGASSAAHLCGSGHRLPG